MEAFLFEHKKDFSKTQLLCLKALSHYASKVKGVSNVSIRKLLKSLSEQGISVSESTFHRMKRLAIKLGILESISTKRTNGSSSSNLWVFKRWLNNDTPKNEGMSQETPSNQQSENKGVTSLETSSLSKTNKNKELRIDNLFESPQPTFVSDWVNKEFSKLALCFFQPEQVEELWKISHIHGRIFKLDSSMLVEQAIYSIKQLVRGLKGKGTICSINGYFNGIVKKKMRSARYSQLSLEVWGI
jgi:hypothetical protein